MAMSSIRKPVAFRLRSDTAARLQRHAREVRETQTSLVERYIEEGLRTDRHPAITFRAGASGRRPSLLGTRLDLWQVIATIRQNDNSVARAAEYLGLSPERIQACLRYYADYQDEVDDWAERAQRIADREEASARRQQELLA